MDKGWIGIATGLAVTGIAKGLGSDIDNGWAEVMFVDIGDGIAIGLAWIDDTIGVCSDWTVGIVKDVRVGIGSGCAKLWVIGKAWGVDIGWTFVIEKRVTGKGCGCWILGVTTWEVIIGWIFVEGKVSVNGREFTSLNVIGLTLVTE
jgi:hypothetical protein